MRVLFFLSFLFAFNFSIAQITLTRTDFPKPTTTSTLPDSVEFTTVSDISLQTSTGINGANVSWNETALSGTSSFQTFYPMSATPLIFQAIFFGSDYAQSLLGNAGANVANLPLTDAFEYYNYNSSSTRLEIRGFGGNLTIPPSTVAIPIPALYSSADVLYRFPINYGNVDSSTSSFDIQIPFGLDSARIKRVQTRTNTVDAWGSMTTPFGTFDVLRVNSDIQRVDSILFPPLINIGFPSNPVEYKWIANGKKIPVLQINGTNLAGSFTAINATYLGVTIFPNSISNINSKNKFVIAPNPVVNNCTINYELIDNDPVDLFLLNIKGQIISQFHFKNKAAGKYHEILPLQILESGTYFVKIKTGSSEIFTQKIIKE